jgi:hypothetical protein
MAPDVDGIQRLPATADSMCRLPPMTGPDTATLSARYTRQPPPVISCPAIGPDRAALRVAHGITGPVEHAVGYPHRISAPAEIGGQPVKVPGRHRRGKWARCRCGRPAAAPVARWQWMQRSGAGSSTDG